MKTVLTREIILECINEGLNVPKIAKKYYVSQSAVRNAARRYGVSFPESDYFSDRIPEDGLTELVNSGMTVSQIADFYGMHLTTVRKYLKKYELKASRQGFHRNPNGEAEEDLLKDAIIIPHEVHTPTVVVDGKKYTDVFELLWEQPEKENPYDYIGKPKPRKGMYGEIIKPKTQPQPQPQPAPQPQRKGAM